MCSTFIYFRSIIIDKLWNSSTIDTRLHGWFLSFSGNRNSSETSFINNLMHFKSRKNRIFMIFHQNPNHSIVRLDDASTCLRCFQTSYHAKYLYCTNNIAWYYNRRKLNVFFFFIKMRRFIFHAVLNTN